MHQPHRPATPAYAGLVLCLSLVVLAPRPAAGQADAVLTWNENAGRAALAACLAPTGNGLAEARMYAMVHAAIHDALNAIDRHSRPYAYDAQVIGPTSSGAAIATAARDVLVSVIGQLQESPACIQAGISSAEADYASALAAIPNGNAKSSGIAVGHASAEAILALRAADGSVQTLADFAYPQGTEPGEYRFTPGTPFAFAPDWGAVTPFALSDSRQFWPAPPYRVADRRYAADYNEIKAVGRDTSTTRTADQTEIALFWLESSPLAWNRLARAVSVQEGLSLHENARLFGLLNLGMADAYIASWEAKYAYNFWRPVTAIQLGDDDGNPETTGDPTWAPLVPTPPIPDHDSGHAIEGGVAAEVLQRFFGTDTVPFTACSRTLPANTCTNASPRLRAYASFSQAADENAVSRIYVGFHFRRAVEVGTEHGRKIGHFVVEKYFRPVQP